MTIAQYVRLLREQWIIVVTLALLGALGAYGYAATQTPIYQAQVRLFVSPAGTAGDLANLVQVSTWTQQRVKSYTDLVSSHSVMQAVITDLDLPYTPEQLAADVTATSPLDTVLLDIAVTDPNPARAQEIADSVAVQFPKLIDTLERPTTRNAPSPVRISAPERATLPTAPISPKTSLDLALGLLVGLGLGVGAAVLRDSLDRTVGSREQAAELTGVPVLAAVADDPTVAEHPLITYDSFSPRAEAFRQLRTNIRFLSVDHSLRSLVVTGSVEAEGKSTTAANLAIALAQNGEQVVLIDADLRRPSLAAVFSLHGGVGLTTVLLGDLPVGDALQDWRPDLPLRVLTSGPPPPNPSELVGSARMAELIDTLTAAGATVVLDSPPLLPVTDAAILARITDGALVVTRVGSTRTDQLAAAVDSLRTAKAAVLGVVLNRVPRKGTGGGRYADSYSYEGRYAPTEAVAPAGSLLAQDAPAYLAEAPGPVHRPPRQPAAARLTARPAAPAGRFAPAVSDPRPDVGTAPASRRPDVRPDAWWVDRRAAGDQSVTAPESVGTPQLPDDVGGPTMPPPRASGRRVAHRSSTAQIDLTEVPVDAIARKVNGYANGEEAARLV